jgi:hypothetical protein
MLTTWHPTARRGVSQLFIGWGTSPVLASLAAGLLFFLTRTFVLRHKNSYHRSLYVMPICVWVTVFTICFTVIQVGGREVQLSVAWAYREGEGRGVAGYWEVRLSSKERAAAPRAALAS